MEYNIIGLKGKAVKEQVRAIEYLISRNPNLGNEVKSMLLKERKPNIILRKVTGNTEYLLVASLLVLILCDIATIPDQVTRFQYIETLQKLCKRFKVNYADVEYLLDYANNIEELLIGD
ncbi:MAG: hypothetical protein R3F48_13645 [Candidatus Zixiibacteriota bacterium]